MKTLNRLLMLALLAMLSFSLASCDDDYDIAETLEGTWEGNMYISSEYNGVVYDAVYSKICFDIDPFHWTSGSGYWVDYYDEYGWGRNYIANHIDWKVRDRAIYIYFREEGSELWIEDYRLTDRHFTGYIYDGDNRVKFSLIHTSSPRWDDYYYGYDRDWYAKGMVDNENGNATSTEAPKRMLRVR